MVTNWRPSLDQSQGPLYRALADQIVAAVSDGAIPAGAKLPPVRDLAWDLKISPGAVARAYRIATDKGALEATVGRGTFARGPAERSTALDIFMAPSADAKIDLRGNRAVDVGQEADLNAALRRLLDRNRPLPLLDYRAVDDDLSARGVIGAWLGAGPADMAARMVVTAGAQEGVVAVLCALRRGGEGLLACEPIVHPGLKDAAELAGMKLEPVAADDQGVIPEALDAACARRRPDALLLTATLHNPTLSIMGPERRARLVAVARARDLTLGEDNVYGGLLNDPPPTFAQLAPERAWYVNSFSKIVAAGLRAGVVLTPPGETQRLLRAHQAITHKTPYLTTALAEELVLSGEADRIRDRVAAEIGARVALTRQALGDLGVVVHQAASFAMLPMPEPWTSAEFAVAAAARDVLVAPRAAYAVARAPAPDFIRIALGANVGRAELAEGLARLSDLIRRGPGAALLT
ncbi:MAG: PLP-dependent aminotransferase family protein [Rubrimonas sp.]